MRIEKLLKPIFEAYNKTSWGIEDYRVERQGYRDAQNGIDINPYSKGSNKYAAWMKGYYSAVADDAEAWGEYMSGDRGADQFDAPDRSYGRGKRNISIRREKEQRKETARKELEARQHDIDFD